MQSMKRERRNILTKEPIVSYVLNVSFFFFCRDGFADIVIT